MNFECARTSQTPRLKDPLDDRDARGGQRDHRSRDEPVREELQEHGQTLAYQSSGFN